MFKKPVVVAVAVNIKGIGSSGRLAPRALNIRPAVGKSKKQI
jgi:hypothetical protein